MCLQNIPPPQNEGLQSFDRAMIYKRPKELEFHNEIYFRFPWFIRHLISFPVQRAVLAIPISSLCHWWLLFRSAGFKVSNSNFEPITQATGRREQSASRTSGQVPLCWGSRKTKDLSNKMAAWPIRYLVRSDFSCSETTWICREWGEVHSWRKFSHSRRLSVEPCSPGETDRWPPMLARQAYHFFEYTSVYVRGYNIFSLQIIRICQKETFLFVNINICLVIFELDLHSCSRIMMIWTAAPGIHFTF